MAPLSNVKEALANLKRGPTDLVGIDLEERETRLARLKKAGDGTVTLVSTAILPPVDLGEGEASAISPLSIPPKLKAKYACIALPGSAATVKLLSFPGAFDADAEARIDESLGLENPEKFRVSYELVVEGHGKTESRVLAVALPEGDAAVSTPLLPVGIPAPYSLELAGLATMSSFLNNPTIPIAEEAVGAIDFGTMTSTFALFNKGVLSLVRRFNIGADSLLDKVQETLGVDRETAQGIINDGSFDISQSVSEVMEPLIKQLVVSRDFVERREDCHIGKLYVSGELVSSRDSLDEIKSTMGVDVSFWSPFEGLTVANNAVAGELEGQEWRFSAAVGAALATFEES